MDLRFKNRRAMVTVELAVTLVLIVIALFVTLGLFNNNLRDMVANSNFKNLFNGNGSRTFFSFFNKDYKNAQVYVQIMGEQGLQILRKKANNGVLTAVASLPKSGAPVENTGAYSTISYLSQIITVIMGNQVICETMTTPSTAECGTSGVPGAKYNIAFTGTSLVISPVGDNESVASKAITVTTKGSEVSLVAAKDAYSYDTKDKFNFISNLTSDNASASNALIKTIGYFSSVISRGGSMTVDDNVDAKVGELIIQVTNNMESAHNACIGHTWIGHIEYQKTWVDGCSSDADVVNDSDLSDYKSHLSVVSEYISEYAAQANCIAYPQTQGCSPACTSGNVCLLTNPTVLPSYSAKANPVALTELAYSPMPDKVAIASYKNIGAVTAGISDAFMMTNPLGDTSNMIAVYSCASPSVDPNSGYTTCGSGQHLAATDCCMPNGIDANGNPIVNGTTVDCATDSYLNTTTNTCQVCPVLTTTGSDGVTCACSNGGTFNPGTGTCSAPSSTITCINGYYPNTNGGCYACPYGLPSNGITCTCPTGSKFFVPTDGSAATCACSTGAGTFDPTTLTCADVAMDLATIADNICKTGIATHCDALMTKVPATNSIGTPITIDLMTSYIASPLNDSILSAVKTTRATYLQDRINILKLYNKMLDVIWNGKVSILNDLQEDNYNNPKACDMLKHNLLSIAKNAGIISMYSDITINGSKCTPAVK